MNAPEYLADVPRDKRLYQQFGWHPILFAITCSLFLPLAFTEPKIGADRPYVVAGLVVFGGLFLFWEIYRRARAAALVRLPNGIGVYRKGKLDVVATPDSIRRYRLHWFNTLRFFLLPVILAVTFLAFYLQPDAPFLALVGGLLSLLSIASVAYTRVMCVHYFIPRATGRRMQEIVLSRSNIRDHPELHEILGYS